VIGPTILALLLTLAQGEPTAAPSLPPTSVSSATPISEPSVSPTPMNLPGFPTATPSPEPSPIPSGTPIAYGYRFVPHQPEHPEPGTPQIFAVYLNSKTLVSQGPISIKVWTDAGTVKVTSSNGGRQGVIPMIAPGDFEANSKLPKIPFIASGMTVDLEFTAIAADGRRTTVSVPVALK
jgi:hypothetical protein